MMKTLNYVNMFNHGINEVWHLLKENNSPQPDFNAKSYWRLSKTIHLSDGKGKANVFANAIKHDFKSPNPTTRWSDIIKLK